MAESGTAAVQVRPISTEKKSSFAGDVLKLVSGTTIAQAIGVLATPLLTRLYAPEAFGTLALPIYPELTDEALASADCAFVHTGHGGYEGVQVEMAEAVEDSRNRVQASGRWHRPVWGSG